MTPPAATGFAPSFDPLSHSQAASPWRLYKEIRDSEPIFHSEKYDVWFITRHDLVLQALRDHAHFSTRSVFLPARPWVPEVQAELDKGYSQHYLLSNNDPPEHTPLRKAVQRAFTRTQTAAMEGIVEEVANTLIDAFADDGHAEIVEQFAYPFPAMVVARVLGLPVEDVPQLKRWGDDWLALFGDEPDTAKLVEHARGFVAFQKYFEAAFEERRANPRDDLLTDLVQQLCDGTPMPDSGRPLEVRDIVNIPINIMSAGHETGTLLLTSGLEILLSREPEWYERLREDPSLIPAFIEEVLRMESPVHGIFRTTTGDAQVGDVTIPDGSRVLLLYGSANHDERRFEHAERFDPHRRDVGEHLGFGKWTHFCPGSPLARLEQHKAYELLLTRLPNLRVAPEKDRERMMHFWLRGYSALHLEWDTGS